MSLPALHAPPDQGRSDFQHLSVHDLSIHLIANIPKAASSFECDGCGHHASFHSMENPAEDAVLKKWSEQEAQIKEQQALAGASKKRKMISQTATREDARFIDLDDASETDGAAAAPTARGSRSQRKAKNGG